GPACPCRGRAQTTRPAQRTGQPKVGHQLAGLVELLSCVGSEVLVTQHLAGAVAHACDRRRRVTVLFGIVTRGRHLYSSLWFSSGRRLGSSLPKGGEDLVEDRDVLGPAHEGRPAGPVRRVDNT